ncbi:hypothetical protein QUA56_08070 [Microcoleus sp. N3A4]|uniref:hypothetical protein n=1 Tax=Microcoleus sp. N3A4 TaxID=3055379 RepID=UPI002FCFBECF
MTKTVETLTLITSLLGLILALISIWNVSKSIVKRLAIIQNRLDSLKGLMISLKSRVDDVEKYLSASGYHVRSSNDQIESSFLRQYDENDTGF